jgi:uncharacterized membrane protein YeiH
VYEFDFVGVIGLGFISALGGGITRDILLGRGLPLAFSDLRYLTIALTGGLFGLLCGSSAGRSLGKLLIVVDAAALGCFAVAGSTRASAAGLSFLPSLLVGIITAIGGGSLRDVFSGRTPKVFERSEPYAVVAAVVSTLFLFTDRLSSDKKLSTTIAITAGFLIRVLAIRFQWKTKAARAAQ